MGPLAQWAGGSECLREASLQMVRPPSLLGGARNNASRIHFELSVARPRVHGDVRYRIYHTNSPIYISPGLCHWNLDARL